MGSVGGYKTGGGNLPNRMSADALPTGYILVFYKPVPIIWDVPVVRLRKDTHLKG